MLTLVERGQKEIARPEILQLLGVSLKATDHLIHSLRRKGWLERASWGKYILIAPDQGPQAIGESNLLALASRIAKPYYIGFGTAASYFGFTTQHRNLIYLVTPMHLRNRRVGEAEVKIVNPVLQKFFGFAPVDIFGREVILSDHEKTVLDCIDRPELAGGIGEVAYILGTASRRLDWKKAVDYLEQIGSTSLTRRFGWLVDHVKADIPKAEWKRLIQLAGQKGKTFLGPKSPIKDAIGYNHTWHLFINVSKTELHGSAGLGHRRIAKKR